MRLHHDPIPESTAWARYRELHRAARHAGERPTEKASVEWLTFFFPEFLDREDRRPAVVEAVRRRASTGKNRFRAACRYPFVLAEALTAARFGVTVKAVRNAVNSLERRSGRT
jgi:hypothetical protein